MSSVTAPPEKSRPKKSRPDKSTPENTSPESRSPLVVIFITIFIDLVGFGIIIPTSQFIARDFGASAIQIGLLMSIYSFTQFIFSPFWGSLSDRIGRRPTILVTLLGSSASYFLFAFSGSLTLLFVARGLAGLFGGNISTAHAYIGDVTTSENRSKGMGLIGAAFGLGFVCGPLIGVALSIVGQKLGSAPPFGLSFSAFGVGILCLVNFTFAFLTLKESLSPELRAAAKTKQKLSRFKNILKQIRRPVAGPMMFVYFLSGLAMALMEPMLIPFVSDDFGWEFREATYGLAYLGFIMVITQGYFIRKLMPKFGEPKVLTAGLVMFAISLFGIGISSTIALLGISITLLALGNGMMRPPNLGIISLSTPSEEQGVSMGVTNSLASIGRVVGPAMGGVLYAEISHGAPFIAAGIFAGLALAITLICYRKLPGAGLGITKK